jgi:hypothetical protein
LRFGPTPSYGYRKSVVGPNPKGEQWAACGGTGKVNGVK